MKTTTETKPQLKNNMKTKLIALLALVTLPALGGMITPISNLGQTFDGGGSMVNLVGGISDIAVSFTTGSQATYLSSVTIMAGVDPSYHDDAIGNFVLSLYSNDGTIPGSNLTILTGSNPNNVVADLNDFAAYSQYTYTDLNSTLLAPNTTYWIVASDRASGLAYLWGGTSSTSLDAGSSWAEGQKTGFLQELPGGFDPVWLLSNVNPNPFNPLFSVQVNDSSNTAAAVPETSTYMASLSMAAILGLGFLRKPRSTTA